MDNKENIQNQWNNNPCGSHYAEEKNNRVDFFKQVKEYRFNEYAPWLKTKLNNYENLGDVLEVGGGLGTDGLMIAPKSSSYTDLDITEGHLNHAKENFQLNNVDGNFVLGDAENMPFEENKFNFVYSNGVLHHTKGYVKAFKEVYRVLKKEGKGEIILYHKNSLFFLETIILYILKFRFLKESLTSYMSNIEIGGDESGVYVKVFSKKEYKKMLENIGFKNIEISIDHIAKQDIPFHQILPKKLIDFIIKNYSKKYGWYIIAKFSK